MASRTGLSLLSQSSDSLSKHSSQNPVVLKCLVPCGHALPSLGKHHYWWSTQVVPAHLWVLLLFANGSPSGPYGSGQHTGVCGGASPPLGDALRHWSKLSAVKIFFSYLASCANVHPEPLISFNYSTEAHTLPYVRQITSESVTYKAGHPKPLLWDNLEGLGEGGRELGVGFGMQGTHVCLWPIHVGVWQTPWQYCKVTIL